MTEILPQTLLKRWLKRARESQLAHYTAGEQYPTYHFRIGAPAAVFSAIVGTAVFATLDANEHLDISVRMAVGLISIVTAILTGCQTFMRFAERADRHRSTGAKYSAVRREIEARLTYPAAITSDQVDQIRNTLDHIAAAAPNVSASMWRKAVKATGNDYLWNDDDVAGPTLATPAKPVRPATER